MKKLPYLIFTAISVIIFSCSQKKDFAPVYKGSIEGGDWINIHTIGYYGSSHTGDCSSKIDSANQYSYGFCKILSEISENPIKKLNVSVWLKLADINKKVPLVVVITDKNNKNIYWEGRDINPAVKEVNKWYKFSSEYELPKYENEGTKVSIYVWNPNKNNAFVDDFELKFSE